MTFFKIKYVLIFSTINSLTLRLEGRVHLGVGMGGDWLWAPEWAPSNSGQQPQSGAAFRLGRDGLSEGGGGREESGDPVATVDVRPEVGVVRTLRELGSSAASGDWQYVGRKGQWTNEWGAPWQKQGWQAGDTILSRAMRLLLLKSSSLWWWNTQYR